MLQIPASLNNTTAFKNYPSTANTHIHVTSEGGQRPAGGNTAFINNFCKEFGTTARMITLVPCTERNGDDLFTQAELIQIPLRERTIGIAVSEEQHQTVLYLRPIGQKASYYQHHTAYSRIAENQLDNFTQHIRFKDSDINNELKQTVALTMKLALHRNLAGQFVAQCLLPQFADSTNLFVHDHFFGGSLSLVANSRAIPITWFHSLTSYMGIGDGILDGSEILTPKQMSTMKAAQIADLPSHQKPPRAKGIEHAVCGITVSQFGKQFLETQVEPIAGLLKHSQLPLHVIKSSPNLQPYSLTALAQQYGIDAIKPSVIKAVLKAKFFASELPLKPPAGSNEDQPILFFMGRPNPEKGTEHILELLKQTNNLMIVVSRGAENNRFIQQLSSVSNDRGKLIHLNQDQQHKNLSMAISDVALCPSLADSLGLVAPECEAMGMKVVMLNVGGLPEAVPDCDDCRTIVKGTAQYEQYEAIDGERFIEQVKSLDDQSTIDPDHIVEHVHQHHDPSQLKASITAVLEQAKELKAEKTLTQIAQGEQSDAVYFDSIRALAR